MNLSAESNKQKIAIAEEHNLQGIKLAQAGFFDRAISLFKEAVHLYPEYAEAYSNLGKAYNETGDFENSIRACQNILTIVPDSPATLQNIAKTYGEMGRLNESLSYYYKAIELNPLSSTAFSDLFLTLNYTFASREAVFMEHLKFSRFNKKLPAPKLLKKGKDGRINVGYVSGDFREHPAAYLIAPVLKNHDRDKFKIFLYSNTATEDFATADFKKYADVWRNICGINDIEAARLVKKDEIDILVDLSGHTGGNRLLIFAEKPAPVQISWLGYMNTTGFSSIDYRITDNFLAPAGAESFYTEKIIRVPDYFTFEPFTEPPPIANSPFVKNGYITFAYLGNYKKVNDRVFSLWVRILKAIPDSRMLLSAKGNSFFHESIKERFAGMGIKEERVKIVGLKFMKDFLRLFDEADISLDPFPFTGCITTLHSLWAGVPSVVRLGEAEYGRNAAAVMRKAGLMEFVAKDDDEYVRIAVNWASKKEELRRLRQKMRERFNKNEAREVTRNVENTFMEVIRRSNL